MASKEHIHRTTQGNKKMRQVLEDIVRNKNFLNDFNKYLSLSKSNAKVEQPSTETALLMFKVLELEKLQKRIMKRIFKKDIITTKLRKSLKIIAEKYDIDRALMPSILGYFMAEEVGKYSFLDFVDVCEIVGTELFVEEITNGLKRFGGKELDEITHPVMIKLSRLTTKRDLLDFVNKKWPEIKNYLYNNGDEKESIRIRKRPKASRAVLDFIFEKYRNGAQYVVKLLDDKFPGHGLSYSEVTKLFNQERERRKKLIDFSEGRFLS